MTAVESQDQALQRYTDQVDAVEPDEEDIERFVWLTEQLRQRVEARRAALEAVAARSARKAAGVPPRPLAKVLEFRPRTPREATS